MVPKMLLCQIIKSLLFFVKAESKLFRNYRPKVIIAHGKWGRGLRGDKSGPFLQNFHKTC